MNQTTETLDPNGRDPGLVWRDGVPTSSRFDDVYFSRENGLAETAHVFLDGCRLPESWSETAGFTIAETGFGTGLNFLATWDLWRRHRPAGGVLHYLAVEGFPIAKSQLGDTLAAFPALATLATRLCDRYPDRPTAGFHRIWFDDDRVCLTLAIGEVADVLAATEARVDAWFLDGFAPSRNPAMWRPKVLREVARLSVPGARLASFTAAGQVRRDLADVGFDIAKRPGFGRKRDCIAGHWCGPPVSAQMAPWFMPPTARRPNRAAVVGAGIGGAALVSALRRRGIDTLWTDRHGRIGAEASGNPAGLMMARPTVDDSVQGGISGAAFRYAAAEAMSAGLAFGGNGILELATDDAAAEKFLALSAAGRLEPIAARPVDCAEASAIAGVRLDRPALWHSTGGWIDPRLWSLVLAAGQRPARYDIARITRAPEGWALLDRSGRHLAEVGAVFIASAMGSAEMLAGAALPLEAIRGQQTRIGETPTSRRLRACVAFGGYLSPAISGTHVAGATYTRDGFAPGAWPVPVRADDHRRTLSGMPPDLARLFPDGPSILGGRAAVRAVTPDRQPIAGPVCEAQALGETYGHLRTDARRREGGSPPYLQDIYALTGLGSRGLVTAPLMAELAVAQMLGEPWPIERAAAVAVHPNRFVVRALKRRRI